MNDKQLAQKLIGLDACREAREWAQNKDFETAWTTCERGDWMLWLAQKSGVELRPLTAAKAACAEFARPYMKDPRSIAALDMAHAFGRGECSVDDLAYAASYAYAAYAAAYAADAAYAAAYAAYAAAYAAYAATTAASAAYAAADAAYAAARIETLRKCADEVRRIIQVENLKI